LRKATRLGIALAALVCGLSAPVGAATDYRAVGRAAGGDRPLALRIAHVLLARPLALQLTRVRCERAAGASFRGLTLSGVKFHRRVDTAAFRAEIDALVSGAFAVDPAIAEVDLWEAGQRDPVKISQASLQKFDAEMVAKCYLKIFEEMERPASKPASS